MEDPNPVVDASTVIDLLLRNARGEQVRQLVARRSDEDVMTVAHLDAEVFAGLARTHRAGKLDADEVTVLLDRLGVLAVTRLPITTGLLELAWSLRENVAARDALYVAAARTLAAGLVTTDDRLARAVPDVAMNLDAAQP